MALFSSSKPYRAAREDLERYYNEGQRFLQPYNDQGQQQYDLLNSLIGNLTNPSSLQDEWIKGYEQSESSRNAQAMANEQGLGAASSMGLMGSNTALDALQRGTSQIAMDDRQNYLDNLMQKYILGAQLSQGIYNTGAGAASGMSNNAMNMGQNSANLAYAENQANNSLLGGLTGLAGSVAGGYLAGKSKWNPFGGVK